VKTCPAPAGNEHYSPAANDGSDSDSDNSDNRRPCVSRHFHGGPGRTSRTGGSRTTRDTGGLVRQGNLVQGVGSGMGDGSCSEEGGALGAQRDHDTGHVGSGGGGGSNSRVVTGAVRGTPAPPAGTGLSRAGVSSRTLLMLVYPTRGRGWSGWSGACRCSAGASGSGWSGGSGRIPTRIRGDSGRAEPAAGGSATT